VGRGEDETNTFGVATSKVSRDGADDGAEELSSLFIGSLLLSLFWLGSSSSEDSWLLLDRRETFS
jgi:hypothetical protein